MYSRFNPSPLDNLDPAWTHFYGSDKHLASSVLWRRNQNSSPDTIYTPKQPISQIPPADQCAGVQPADPDGKLSPNPGTSDYWCNWELGVS